MTAPTQTFGTVEKQQFINNTGGYIGVTVIGPRGEDHGASVEAGGTVWLSEAEQRLTANAPRLAADNPFIMQRWTRRNPETGALEQYDVTPLTPCSNERYVPADTRPIPATMSPAAVAAIAAAAATGPDPVSVRVAGDPVTEREEAVMQSPTAQPTVPTRALQAAQAARADATEETASAPAEETGAATPPTSPPPVGDYAANEEVGTPVPAQRATGNAPTVSSAPPESGETPPASPPPWNG
jgi:hypothetical protein